MTRASESANLAWLRMVHVHAATPSLSAAASDQDPEGVDLGCRS